MSFGKDLGLVHQAVLAGRRVGAGPEFWGWLAEDSALFSSFVEQARVAVRPSPSELSEASAWLASRLSNEEWPFPEHLTYTATSEERCGYEGYWKDFHNGTLKPLFKKGQHDAEARAICAGIECCFILGYAYSAMYAHVNGLTGHSALNGITTTLRHLHEGSDSVSRGKFLSLAVFRSNENVEKVYRAIVHESGSDSRHTLAACREAMDSQISQVNKFISSLQAA